MEKLAIKRDKADDGSGNASNNRPWHSGDDNNPCN